MKAEQLINLTSSELMAKLDEVKDLTMILGATMAEKKMIFRKKKELLPVKLASITIELSQGYKGTGTMLKNKALASAQYETAVNELASAERDFLASESEYKGAYETIKAIGSISWVRNSELKLAR